MFGTCMYMSCQCGFSGVLRVFALVWYILYVGAMRVWWSSRAVSCSCTCAAYVGGCGWRVCKQCAGVCTATHDINL